MVGVQLFCVVVNAASMLVLLIDSLLFGNRPEVVQWIYFMDTVIVAFDYGILLQYSLFLSEMFDHRKGEVMSQLRPQRSEIDCG